MHVCLYMTYMKDKCEILMRISGYGTQGIRWIYRRSPSDTGVEQRINALLEHIGVHEMEFEIKIFLYPPEILTTAVYVPDDLDNEETCSAIRDALVPGLHYAQAYDLDNFRYVSFPNGHNDTMIIASAIGRKIKQGLKRILGPYCSFVNFLGDGLQFLNQETRSEKRPYQIILRHEENYFIAGFRSELHTASYIVSRNSFRLKNNYKTIEQAIYLDMNSTRISTGGLRVKPLDIPSTWRSYFLPPSAFPLWYLATKSNNRSPLIDHAQPVLCKQSNDQTLNKMLKLISSGICD